MKKKILRTKKWTRYVPKKKTAADEFTVRWNGKTIRVTWSPFHDARIARSRYQTKLHLNGQVWQVWFDYNIPTPKEIIRTLTAAVQEGI